MIATGFLAVPTPSAAARHLFDDDVAEIGRVTNVSRCGRTCRAMADWARKVARDANGTTAADVQAMRDVGFEDAGIFALTAFVALRIAFSTVNDALGVLPDAAFRVDAPEAVRAAVTFGRPLEDGRPGAEWSGVEGSGAEGSGTEGSGVGGPEAGRPVGP